MRIEKYAYRFEPGPLLKALHHATALVYFLSKRGKLLKAKSLFSSLGQYLVDFGRR